MYNYSPLFHMKKLRLRNKNLLRITVSCAKFGLCSSSPCQLFSSVTQAQNNCTSLFLEYSLFTYMLPQFFLLLTLTLINDPVQKIIESLSMDHSQNCPGSLLKVQIPEPHSKSGCLLRVGPRIRVQLFSNCFAECPSESQALLS